MTPNPLTPAELDRMEAVAKAAMAGPWQNGIDDFQGVVAPHNDGLGNVVCLPPLKRMCSSLEAWDANAAHIATFDPPTVLAMIAQLRAQQSALEATEGALGECADKLVGDYGPVDGADHDVRLWSDEDACHVHRRVGSALTQLCETLRPEGGAKP
jgi:hypothetical protein